MTAACQADFHMVDVDNRISNIISSGDGESDLYLTFTFEWNFPEIAEGTAEATTKQQELQESGQEAVATSIAQLRELVQGHA